MSEQRHGLSELSFFPFQMVSVRLFDVQIEYRDVDPEVDEQLPLKVRLLGDESPPDAEEFGLLLRFETFFYPDDEDKGYFISFAVEGIFQAIVDVETVKPDLVKQFKSRDAAILLWPYLRQTLQDFATRMHIDLPLLPIIDARALLTPPEEEDAAIDSEGTN